MANLLCLQFCLMGSASFLIFHHPPPLTPQQEKKGNWVGEGVRTGVSGEPHPISQPASSLDRPGLRPPSSFFCNSLLLLLSRFNRVRLQSHRQQPTRLPRPWDSPGQNTGVGCHFLLQCMKVKSESEVAQSCPTPSDPMDCSLPGSSVHGILL